MVNCWNGSISEKFQTLMFRPDPTKFGKRDLHMDPTKTSGSATLSWIAELVLSKFAGSEHVMDSSESVFKERPNPEPV